jgi:hypothetical protein
MTSRTITCALCLLLGVMVLAPGRVAGAETGRAVPGSILRAWAPLPDEALDRVRGGFVDLGGLTISFGLQRQVWVNGELMQSLTFTVPDLLSLRKGSIGAVSVQGPVTPQLAAVPPAVAPATLLPPASASTAASAPVAQQVAAPAASSLQDAVAAAPAAPPPSTGSVGAVVAPTSAASIVQVGPGNTVKPEVLSNFGPGVLTVVQNSLNSQAIQGITVLNAHVSGLGAFLRNSTFLDLQFTLRGAGR